MTSRIWSQMVFATHRLNYQHMFFRYFERINVWTRTEETGHVPRSHIISADPRYAPLLLHVTNLILVPDIAVPLELPSTNATNTILHAKEKLHETYEPVRYGSCQSVWLIPAEKSVNLSNENMGSA